MPRKLPPGCQHDAHGRMVLIGLTFEETKEFRKLDASLPYTGKSVWPDETLPMLPMEVRWLELWMKHRQATAAKRA